MNWVKDALLDIIAFGVIVAYAITHNNVLEIILWVYTGFLLIGKILYFFVDFLQSRAIKTSVPEWFYHTIYFLSIVILFLTKDFYLTASWGLVWLLSIIPIITKAKKATK